MMDSLKIHSVLIAIEEVLWRLKEIECTVKEVTDLIEREHCPIKT
jgi:hypothetical protein